MVVWVGTAASQTTNIVFVENVADSLVEKLVKTSPDILSGPVCIVNAGGQHDLDWLFEHRFVTYFQKQTDQKIYVSNKTDGCFSLTDRLKPLHTVEYDIQAYKIEYTPGKTGLDSPDLYQRSVGLSIYVRVLTQPEGRLVWNGSLEEYESDIIDKSAIPTLESDDEAFTHGNYIKPESGGSVFQPIVVATVTGVIVYLFFAFRSR